MWEYKRRKALVRLNVADTHIDRLPFDASAEEIDKAFIEVTAAIDEYITSSERKVIPC